MWVINVADAAASRLTFTSGSAASPVWAADGRRVLYQLSTGRGAATVYARHANGAGSEDRIGSLESNEPPGASRSAYRLGHVARRPFSRLSIIGRQRAADLWVLPLDGDRKPYPFEESPFHKAQAQISPNGRWIAYT